VGGAGTSADDSGNSMGASIQSSATINKWELIKRSIVLFDTSSLPDTVNVTSSTLAVRGLAKADAAAWGTTIGVFASTPSSNTALASGDYAQLGSTELSDTITYAAFSIVGYNTFTLNAAGKAAISLTGISKFGLREHTYDAHNVEPAYIASKTSSFSVWTTEKGVGYKPTLVVNYTTPTITSLNIYVDGVLADTEVITVSVPDNANQWVFCQNNVMPYVEYYKHTVAGTLITWYQPVSYIVGTTLPDRQGAAEDATIVWGTNDAGVSVNMGAFSLAPASSTTTEIETVGAAPEANVGGDLIGIGTQAHW
jgi:hypothetical protein